MNDWLARIVLRFRRVRTGADIEEELRTHLDLAAEDQLLDGMRDDEARRRARLKLGASDLAIAEQIADGEILTRIEALWHDLAAGYRAVRNTPMFSILTVLILALGIGANTAIFSLLYAFLLRDLPVQRPGELASISLVRNKRSEEFRPFIPTRLAEAYGTSQQSFSALGLWDMESLSMTDRGGTRRLYDAALVSGEAFATLGVEPHLGHLLQPSDIAAERAGRWPVVLDFHFWKDRFSGDRNVLGAHLEISGAHCTIVGIAPAGFEGVSPGIEPKVYLPLSFVSVISAKDVLHNTSLLYWCSAIGRLKSGVSLKQAQAEARSLQPQLFKQVLPPEIRDTTEVELSLRSARRGVPPKEAAVYSNVLFIVQALALSLLLLCTANVAGLMLARAYSRRREFSVRAAIGAARVRLARQYLSEGLILSLGGALLGGVAAWFGAPAALQFFRDPNMFAAPSIRLDSTAFAMTTLATLSATMVFGVLPALRAAGADCGVLPQFRGAGEQRNRGYSKVLIPLQVGVSLTLLAIAVLLSQSLRLIGQQQRGFNLDHVTIQTPPFHRLPQRGNAELDLYQRVIHRVEGSAGVRSASIAWFTPMSGAQAMDNFTTTATGTGKSRTRYIAYNLVGPGYFRTMETNLLAGREFLPQERDLRTCIVNRAAADQFFPDESPLGRYLGNQTSDALETAGRCRIVGLVENAKFASLRDPAPPTVYYPVVPQNGRMQINFVFLINSQTKQQAIHAYSKAIAEVVPDMPLVLFATLHEQMDASIGCERLISLVSNLSAGAGVLLSAIGLCGLLTATISRRKAEIGIRMALGAQRARVILLVLWEAAKLLAIGLALGAIGLACTVRFIDKWLFGVSQSQPILIGASFLLLTAVTLGAGAVPALRAATIDPLRALRAE